MDKKKLYESIMMNVAREVKKALCESGMQQTKEEREEYLLDINNPVRFFIGNR